MIYKVSLWFFNLTPVGSGKERLPDSWGSYFGVFGDPLLDAHSDPYPEGLLAKLAAKGINGVWMHVVLNQLAPGGKEFPEFGEGHQDRLANLKRIAQQAKKYGIKIYLYLNEPRAMPLAFFKNRSQLAGLQKEDFMTMCTSNEIVLNWISNSLTYVFKEVPDLDLPISCMQSLPITLRPWSVSLMMISISGRVSIRQNG